MPVDFTNGLYHTLGSAKLDLNPICSRVWTKCDLQACLELFNPYKALTINTGLPACVPYSGPALNQTFSSVGVFKYVFCISAANRSRPFRATTKNPIFMLSLLTTLE